MEMYDSRAPDDTKGAAGVKCSINDLAKYLTMMLNQGRYRGKRIISRRHFRKILEESVEGPPARKKEYRGICWRIWKIDDSIYSMHHAAHMNGAGGFMQLFPRDNIGYVFISNPPVYDREEFYSFYYGVKHRMIRFCDLFIDNSSFDPMAFRADRPIGKELQRFVGRYEKYGNGRYIDVFLRNGKYLVARKSYTGGHYGIIPTSMHTFVYIYPGQSEKGEIFDFVVRRKKVIGLGVKDGYYIR
jgi:CubicO group peptidase (beta-lactamase class C family)